MIDLTATRQGIEQIIRDHCPSVRSVYPRAIDTAVPAFPAVVLAALVSGEFDTAAVACPGMAFDTINLGAVVLVARSGVDEVATQTELELVWVEVLAALRENLPRLGTARVKSVDPGTYVIGSAEYPGQILNIEIKG